MSDAFPGIPTLVGPETRDREAGLTVHEYTTGYGRRDVVRAVSFVAKPGEVTVIVGHNGAGKTTLLSGIAGLLPSRGGEIKLDATRILGLPAWKRARHGAALVPDGARGIFRDMTVAENLDLSAVCGGGATDRRRIERMSELVSSLFPGVLHDRRDQLAGSLSGGQRQMLAIAVALARGPSLLMLDEPSLGLAPVLVEQVLLGVQTVVKDFGLSCLLVEQNVGAAMSMADSLLVLKDGRIVASFERASLPAVEQLWNLF